MIKDRWIFGDSIDGERMYVIHNDYPRFIAVINEDDTIGGTPGKDLEWLDPEPHRLPQDTDPAMFYARLMREAGEALQAYIRHELEEEHG